MSTYRFSPIQSEEKLRKAVEYVATKTSEMAEKIIGKKLPISSLTIFSHAQEEYEKLLDILDELGSFYNRHNGLRIALYPPIKIGTNTITHLRVREPDSERPQVGCNDFNVEDYDAFKEAYLSKHPDNLRLIERQDYEMIEFSDPEYDVLAYIVSG